MMRLVYYRGMKTPELPIPQAAASPIRRIDMGPVPVVVRIEHTLVASPLYGCIFHATFLQRTAAGRERPGACNCDEGYLLTPDSAALARAITRTPRHQPLILCGCSARIVN